MKVNFEIDDKVFAETPTKEIADITLVVKYRNPQAYGYPEICNWSESYGFNVEQIRRKINEKN